MAVPNASANGLKLFFFSFQAAHAHVRVVADRSTICKKKSNTLAQRYAQRSCRLLRVRQHYDAAEMVAALASLAHADHAQCRLQVVERGAFERWQGRVGYVSSLGA